MTLNRYMEYLGAVVLTILAGLLVLAGVGLYQSIGCTL